MVEYVDGVLQIHEKTVRIMTNDPDYDWHLKNLNNYVNVSAAWPVIPPSIIIDTEIGKIPSISSHGYNLTGLPADYSPPSRFVRMFYLRQYS